MRSNWSLFWGSVLRIVTVVGSSYIVAWGMCLLLTDTKASPSWLQWGGTFAALIWFNHFQDAWRTQ